MACWPVVLVGTRRPCDACVIRCTAATLRRWKPLCVCWGAACSWILRKPLDTKLTASPALPLHCVAGCIPERLCPIESPWIDVMGSVVRIRHSAMVGTMAVAEIDSAGRWRDTQTRSETTPQDALAGAFATLHDDCNMSLFSRILN